MVPWISSLFISLLQYFKNLAGDCSGNFGKTVGLGGGDGGAGGGGLGAACAKIGGEEVVPELPWAVLSSFPGMLKKASPNIEKIIGPMFITEHPF
jgi:hypothetical protein